MDGIVSVETSRSICEIAAALAAGHISSEAVVSGYLDRIGQANPRLNAFVALAENALPLARGSPAGAIPMAEVDEALSPTVFTRFANYMDLPALSIPIGVTSEGMPVGLQFAARRNADALLLDFGAAAARSLEFPLPRFGWET